MQPSPDPPATTPSIDTVEFRTADGTDLAGDMAVPTTPRAAAILCHPHPSYGGNRFDHVVGALFEALPAVGVAALRFDFRPDFGGGIAEIGDAVAALGTLGREVQDVPMLAAGYSFGAMVALAVDPHVVPVAAKILIAPPLAAMDVPSVAEVPTLVITPEHDQFTPPAAAEPIVSGWRDATLETVPMVDHFLHGGTARVVDLAVRWIDALLA